MNSGVRNQVGLELVQINIQCTIKSERAGNARNYLSNQAVQVLKARSWDIQVATADVVNSLIVNQERTIGVLNSRVS